MGEMPPDGFAMSGTAFESQEPMQIPSADAKGTMETETPSNAQNNGAQSEAAESDEQTKDTQTEGASSSTGKTRANPSQRNTGRNWGSGLTASGMPGAAESAQNDDSSMTLLIASMIVLLLSIAFALFVKH